MTYETKRIIWFFSIIISIIVLLLATLQLGILIRGFLCTVILGLLCFMRSLLTAVDISDNNEDGEKNEKNSTLEIYSRTENTSSIDSEDSLYSSTEKD